MEDLVICPSFQGTIEPDYKKIGKISYYVQQHKGLISHRIDPSQSSPLKSQFLGILFWRSLRGNMVAVGWINLDRLSRKDWELVC